jgi:DNA-binding transcriptional regulator/RsmH inhibitor MraZ
MIHKEREQEEIFLFELNKLKKTEESLRELQVQAEEKAREAERIIAEGTQTK